MTIVKYRASSLGPDEVISTTGGCTRMVSLPDKSVTAVNLKENATSAISCL